MSVPIVYLRERGGDENLRQDTAEDLGVTADAVWGDVTGLAVSSTRRTKQRILSQWVSGIRENRPECLQGWPAFVARDRMTRSAFTV